MDILSNFSETLSELIAIHNLSTVKLEKEINIDCTSFSKYLNKRVIPTLRYAIAIADYFRCSLDYLFGLTNERQEKKYLSTPPFHQVFQEVLKTNNCTKYRLAKDLGLTTNSLIDWYYGRRVPTIDNIIILAGYFDCTLDEFVGRKAAD